MDDRGFNFYYNKATNLCSRYEKCKFDLQDKLNTWGANDVIAEKVIAKLEDEKYIDEARFADCYVRDKFRFNSWGKTKIRHYLRHKQIADRLINRALEGISEIEYLEKLQGLMAKKESSIKFNNEYDKRNKLIRFAVGRGFELDAIMKIIKA